MKRNLLTLTLVTAVVLAGVPAVQASDSQVIGSPDLELSISDNRVEASEHTTLTVSVSNSGDIDSGGPSEFQQRVTTARNVKLDVLGGRIDAPIEVKTGDVVLGSVADGQPRAATFEIETGADLEPGRYTIPVEVSYDYTRVVNYDEVAAAPGYANPEYGEYDVSSIEHLTLVVEEQPQFSITDESTNNLFVGDTGTLNLELANNGSEVARDATVTFSATSNNVFFGTATQPQASTSVFVSSLQPGETADLDVKVGATEDIEPGSYPVDVSVQYKNTNDVTETADTLTTGVTVNPERKFELRNLSTDGLRVGENDVTVTGDVVNVGESTAHNTVVTLSTVGPIQATGPESAVDDLAPGESKPVAFKLAVSEDAEPGSRSLSFGVQYENVDGDLLETTTPIRKTVQVGPEQDTFEIAGVNTSLEAGGSAELRVDIENTGDETVEDANAKVFVNDPLSSSDNGAYLGQMEPGETKTAVFKVSAGNSAIAKAYAASIEVRYEDESGDSELADGLQLGVPVQESSGGLPLTYIGGGVVVVVVALGIFVWQRD